MRDAKVGLDFLKASKSFPIVRFCTQDVRNVGEAQAQAQSLDLLTLNDASFHSYTASFFHPTILTKQL